MRCSGSGHGAEDTVSSILSIAQLVAAAAHLVGRADVVSRGVGDLVDAEALARYRLTASSGNWPQDFGR
jgi:pyridoxal/pyridoxine/pyridoxamine kinase